MSDHNSPAPKGAQNSIAQDTVAQNRDTLRAAIATAANAVGRDPSDIVLTAVSKKQPDARIQAGLATGHRIFGENRVQEAKERWTTRRAIHPDVQLRLVGPLQTNKVKDAIALFDVIETVDRDKLARTLAAARDANATNATDTSSGTPFPQLFVQINTGEEEQKAGIPPLEADAFIARMRNDYELPVAGLMCIPPQHEEPALHFALLADIAARNGVTALSMGMSGDFQTAIRHGATHVRVGSAFFGAREG